MNNSLTLRPFITNAFSIIEQAGLIFTRQLKPATTVRAGTPSDSELTSYAATILHPQIPLQSFSVKILATAESLEIQWKSKKDVTFNSIIIMAVGEDYSEEETIVNTGSASFLLPAKEMKKAAELSFSLKESDKLLPLLTIKIDAYKPNPVSG